MIKAEQLSKKYGDKLAVDQLTFEVKPGIVTGFLGPNGAGKSTTMRMILGIDNPSGGRVTVNGKSYRDLAAPIQEIGALLDASAVHVGRSAWHHLNWQAKAAGLATRRVDEVLELVGLNDVAGRKVGGFSLGMYQRLGIASALLGDPPALILDEPVNGLDPEGIRWVRSLFRRFADEGRTVFVSSHLMSEMELTADHVLVIGRGKLIADMPIAEITQRSNLNHVKVVAPQAAQLALLLESAGASISQSVEHELIVSGITAPAIGEIAVQHGIVLHELAPRRASLEAAFMELTHDSVDYRAAS